MQDKFLKLLSEKKKSGDMLNPMEKDAKLQAVKELMSAMKDSGGENLKKVMVASPSTEGLKEGLEKAEEVVEQLPGSEKPEEMSSMEEMPSMEEKSEEDELSPEKIDEMIRKLEELKRQKSVV